MARLVHSTIILIASLSFTGCTSSQQHGLATNATVADSQTDSLQERDAAMTRLATAEPLKWVIVGYQCRTPQEAIDFRSVLNRTDAADLCDQLVREATPAGQLYGLAGLALVAPERYGEAEARLLRNGDTPVKTLIYCVGSTYTIKEAILLLEVEDGKFARAFMQ